MQPSEEIRSRPTSRRSSVSLPHRQIPKREKDKKPTSAQSTPKKNIKNIDFVITGKQLLKKSDRANSLPSSCRRASIDKNKGKTLIDSKTLNQAESIKSIKNKDSFEDLTLDLSQVSGFDSPTKHGTKHKMRALATSTPKPSKVALQTQCSENQENPGDSTSNTSFNLTSTSTYRASDDCSSVSPEYSPSSSDVTPHTVHTPHASSCYVSSLQESDSETKLDDGRDGEWSQFWWKYNETLAHCVPREYDHCPTPYRSDTIDLTDFDMSAESSRKRSPNSIININNIIRNEGLSLTPRETQNMIKCAHIFSNVLSKAIERRSVEKQIKQEKNLLKDKLTLNLKETALPLPVSEKRTETVTTQTDISLPNTKSAPKIFESILRQLSKSSIDDSDGKEENGENEKYFT